MTIGNFTPRVATGASFVRRPSTTIVPLTSTSGGYPLGGSGIDLAGYRYVAVTVDEEPTGNMSGTLSMSFWMPGDVGCNYDDNKIHYCTATLVTGFITTTYRFDLTQTAGTMLAVTLGPLAIRPARGLQIQNGKVQVWVDLEM